ncbi:MAG: SDR family NAD(P)-dependent oxidoreductase, partial [Paracoccaceae bacterium]
MTDTTAPSANLPLAGQVAIITGGGRDIGRACALRLAASGAAVSINYHSSSEGAESAVAEITAAGGRALCKQGDMTSDADVAALIDATTGAFGSKINVLVHVTGGLVARKTIAEMDVDHWNAVMDLNVTCFM